MQAWTIGAATGNLPGMFFGRPISIGIIVATLVTLSLPALAGRRAMRKESGQ